MSHVLLTVGHQSLIRESGVLLVSLYSFKTVLDTLKLGIPLTEGQHKRIQKIAANDDRWRWVLHQQSTGDILLQRHSGLALTDCYSYHRELKWDTPATWSPGAVLTLEFSVPKFWYGHNIHLLYDFMTALQHLKQMLEHQFGLKGRAKLPGVAEWKVNRADICYAWRFPSQRLAQSFLDSLKRHRYPRKTQVHYPTTILLKGNTYSLKLYLKQPEFKNHDLKELLKTGASLEWLDHLESSSDGVLRFEATLRQRYLRRIDVSTVADLTQTIRYVEWEGVEPKDLAEANIWLFTIFSYYLHSKGVDISKSMLRVLEEGTEVLGDGHPITDGMRLEAPPIDLTFNGREFYFPGGAVTFREKSGLLVQGQKFLERLTGGNLVMHRDDQILSTLLTTYKPNKAARLAAFWKFVQSWGSESAREFFGKNPYYRSRAELKKAGISLIEPPSDNTLTLLEKDFAQEFRLEMPSSKVVNLHDDFRESANLLNFVPKASGMDC